MLARLQIMRTKANPAQSLQLASPLSTSSLGQLGEADWKGLMVTLGS